MSASSLSIDKMRTTFLVSAHHPSPERLCEELVGVLTRRLRRALSSIPHFSELDNDESVWLIRKLELETEIDAAWEPDVLATHVAKTVAQSLCRELAGSGDGGNAIRFANRASYLAHFLIDRASGDVDRWYYRRFAGLRMLSTSAALRAAMERDLTLGVEALRAMDIASRRRVIAALSRADTRRLLDGFRRLTSSGDFEACVCAAAEACGRRAGASYGDWAYDAVELFVQLCDGRRSGGPLVRAVEAVSRMTECLASLGGDARGALVTAIRAGDAALASQTAADLAEIVASLAPCADSTRHTIARALAASHGAPTPHAAEVKYSTRFGGAFLLLPDLEAIAGSELSAGIADEGDARVLIRFAVLAHCLCPEAPRAVLEDSVLRQVLGIGAGVDMARSGIDPTAEVLGNVHAIAESVLQTFSTRLPGFAGSRPEYLRRNFLECSATVEWEPSRVVVRLAKPALHVVLTLAGLMRRRYLLSWATETPIEVFPEE